MASNVFGDPVTDETCRNTLEFAGHIGIREKAQAAMFLKNFKNKDVAARKHVKELKGPWEHSNSTLCLIYNATGHAMHFSHSNDWEGKFGSELPEKIENGQWGVLVHVSSRTTKPRSNGAVVYRGKNEHGVERHWMLAWDNLNGRFQSYKVFAEAREVNHYNAAAWNTVSDLMRKVKYPVAHYQDTCHECMSTVTIANDTCPIVEAVFFNRAANA